MDTSETYIKMCSCNEIQENTAYLLDGNDFRSPDGIWLPRQDQLQEMVDISDWRFKLVNCASFLADNFGSFATMEQLWLAFVMKEKYHKIWNGEDWIINKA